MDVPDRQHPLLVGGGRQACYGVTLLLVGAVVAFLLVKAGADVAAAAGLVVAVWGLALIVNGTLLNKRGRLPMEGDDDAAQRRVA